MILPDAGAPPVSVEAYIRDMLKELAGLADRIGDAPLATAIRQAAAGGPEGNPQGEREPHSGRG
jgi:hypothetical protein